MRHTPTKRWRPAAAAAAASLLAATLTGCAAASAEPSEPELAAFAAAPVSAVFVGAPGLVAQRSPHRTTAAEVASWQLGWEAAQLVAPGGGFVTETPTGSPAYAARLASSVDPQSPPDVVVLFTGAGDRTAGSQRLTEAVEETVEQARDRLPLTTRIVVVGPLGGAREDDQLLGVRDAVRDAARSSRVHFVDPLQQRWAVNGSSRWFELDGTTVNPAGEWHFGERLAASLGELPITAAADRT